jgi:hypothetical protein
MIKILAKHDKSVGFNEEVVKALGELLAMSLVKGLVDYKNQCWVQPKSAKHHVRGYVAAVERIAIGLHKQEVEVLKADK